MAERLSKEEKIRRLQEQIKKIQEGPDRPENISFENDHFYVRRYSRRINGEKKFSYELFSKKNRFNAHGNKRYSGFSVQYEDITKWINDAIEATKYMLEDEEE